MSSQSIPDRKDSNNCSEAMFEEIWGSLVQNLDDIFQENKINKRTYIIMHTNVHDICASNPLPKQTEPVTEFDLSNGKWLYDRLVVYLHSICKRIVDRLLPYDRFELLNNCILEWTRFKEAMRLCNDIFSYLNNSWILGISPREGPELVVQNLGYYVWKKTVFAELCPRIGLILTNLISDNRPTGVNDYQLIKSMVEIYVTVDFSESGPADRQAELGLYVEHIEDPFVEQVIKYYSFQKEEHFNSSFNSVESYIRKVDEFILFEKKFMQEYLHKSSFERVESVLRNILIVSMSAEIIHQMVDLIDDSKYSEIKRVHDLFSNCPEQMMQLKCMFEDLVYEHGRSAVEEWSKENVEGLENPTTFVDTVIDVHDRFSLVVQKSFADYKLFYSYVERGCIRFVNSSQHLSPAVILSMHCDHVIRSITRMINRPNFERKFCRMILLLRFIKEKDVFHTNYFKGLAKRLITTSRNKSALEIEKEFISLLKNECGQEYTSKLSRMLNDAASFDSINEEFHRELCERDEPLPYNMNVVVFSSWQFQDSYKLNLPSQMTRGCDLFEEYYSNKNEGRKISWLHNQSYGEVVFNCFRRPYNVSANTYQIAVLMLFNDHIRLSVNEIHKATLIEHGDLIYTCSSLISCQLLLAEDSSGTPKDEKTELTGDDLLSLNVNFSSTMYRLNIIVPERVKSNVDKVVVNVVQDRLLFIESVIMHIMKQRGESTHNDLVTELLSQVSVRFVPEMSMVKEGIESMIKKEYLSRSPNNPLIYHYSV